MSAAEIEPLLARLADLEVRVTICGDGLQLAGPAASLGADLLKQVRDNKAEMIRALRCADAASSARTGTFAARADQLMKTSPELFTGAPIDPDVVAVSARVKRPRETPIIEAMPEPNPSHTRRRAQPPAAPFGAIKPDPEPESHQSAEGDEDQVQTNGPSFWEQVLGHGNL